MTARHPSVTAFWRRGCPMCPQRPSVVSSCCNSVWDSNTRCQPPASSNNQQHLATVRRRPEKKLRRRRRELLRRRTSCRFGLYAAAAPFDSRWCAFASRNSSNNQPKSRWLIDCYTLIEIEMKQLSIVCKTQWQPAQDRPETTPAFDRRCRACCNSDAGCYRKTQAHNGQSAALSKGSVERTGM